ncbi:MAG: hypothetical protein SXG53_04790 [Pseudomonadota bacterium]|nr:hypothetical protein [Pseudomonadota bacterium]
MAKTVQVPVPIQYYLADIEAPFAGAAAVIQLSRICEVKFPGRCRNLTPDDTAAMKEEAELLGAISLFAVPRHGYRAEHFSSPDEILRELDGLKPPLISALTKFDIKFIGRFGATADVCPFAKQESYVKTLGQLVLYRYWNMRDSELSAAFAEVDSIRREYAARLREKFSPDTCVEIRKQGRLLTESFKIRLRESHLDKKGPWQPLTFDQQFLNGAAFLWDFVTKLEADVGNQRFVEYLGKNPDQK